ncbi:MAG: hypothetical protein U9R50_03280, partial [Campylobacterota bacterium]|nr:hypothetical protein [Campylobacterota bacterium]
MIIAMNTKDNYLETLKYIALHVRTEARVILMSSISVYREFDMEVDEETSISKIGLQYEAEQLIQNLKTHVITLRLGGLMGEDRVAGRWSRVKNFTDGIVNYVHRDDVIGVVKNLIISDVSHGLFNVVAPLHPLRSQVHQNNAKKFGFEIGTFAGMSHRKVSSKRLLEDLDY